MSFRAEYPVRFAHCDAAGIVYYPRYLELLDYAVEDWTADVIGVPRRDMHLERRLGLPLVDLHASFSSPSRLGDLLGIVLEIVDVGRSSVTLDAEVACGGRPRFRARLKQVLTNLDTASSVPWPDEWRLRLNARLAKADA